MKALMKFILKILIYIFLNIIHLISRCFKRKPVILLMDRKDAAGDNSEAMYLYLKNEPEYNVYYILDKKSRDWNRLQPDSHIINYRSFKYYWLYTQANVIFTAYSLFKPRGSSFYNNKKCKILWLQHGVIYDDLSKIYNATKGHDLVTVATKPEYEDRLSPKYGYKKSQIVLTGLARYDLLKNNPQKIITISLTWRNYTNKLNIDDFQKTEFYSMWEDLIITPELYNLAEKYGYKVQVIFHHEINKASKDILIKNMISGISIVNNKTYRDIISESSLLLTDYSSVAFDIAYLNKPVIFYQKDINTFFSGKHTCTKGYFDFEEDGFGEIVYDKMELLKLVEEYVLTGCKMKELYSERVSNTFEYRDQNNRERIWKEVQERFLNR